MEYIEPSKNRKFSLHVTLARKLADLATLENAEIPDYERVYRMKKLDLRLADWFNSLPEFERQYISRHRHYITFQKIASGS